MTAGGSCLGGVAGAVWGLAPHGHPMLRMTTIRVLSLLCKEWTYLKKQEQVWL